MVRFCAVALLITGAFSSRIAVDHAHLDIQQFNEPEEGEATCQTAFGEATLRTVPDDCPVAERDCTSNPCTEIPLESCPEPCQTYFTGILDTCSVGDDLGPNLWGYPRTYAQYTVWDQFHLLYPACNLGPTPPACHRTWNRGIVPTDCRRLASFNFTTGRENPLESCPEPCQIHFTEILESCSGQWMAVNLWDMRHELYPMCNLGEPVPGEDSSPGAGSNPDATGPGEDSTPSAGSNPETDSVPEAGPQQSDGEDSSPGAGSNPDATGPGEDSIPSAGSNPDTDSVPEAGPQQSESVRTISGPGLFLLCITMVQAVAVVQCGP